MEVVTGMEEVMEAATGMEGDMEEVSFFKFIHLFSFEAPTTNNHADLSCETLYCDTHNIPIALYITV